MSALIKTQRVLELEEVDRDAAMYAQRDEETGGVVVVVGIPPEVWRDLGRPSQLTVTVEPGDTLNPEAPK